MEGSRAMTVPAELTGEAVRQALRQVKDPELDMNIIDLGLVYDVEVAGGDVRVNMTLTSPGCPAGPMITNDAYRVIRGLEGVTDVDIEIVWEPYWTPERMDPKVRALMGLWASAASSASPNASICQRRSSPIRASPARSFGTGWARATASRVERPHSTPGSRPSSWATRLRATLRRSTRASTLVSRGGRGVRSTLGRSASSSASARRTPSSSAAPWRVASAAGTD